MKLKETKVNQGGLMRCCLSTISQYVEDHLEDDAENLTLDCKHEKPGNQQIKLVDGLWSWNKPETA